MFHLVYISSATVVFSKWDILDIIEKSREKNARLGVTGLLLYRDGSIMQVLEGEEAVVRAVYAEIAADRRHKDVTVVLEEEIGEREFPKWSMAFTDLGLLTDAELPGFSQFLSGPMNVEGIVKQQGKIGAFISTFKVGMR